MKIDFIDISQIKPYEKNPRKISEDAVKLVANSIKKFGWQQPIVVDKKFVIIVGHTRFEASKLLNLKEVPIQIAELDDDKAKAYRIADNKLNSKTYWDYSYLTEELKELMNTKTDLESLGFDKSELDSLLDYHEMESKFNPEEHWQDMPAYEHDDIAPFKSLIVHFPKEENLSEFLSKIGQEITDKTKYIYYPKQIKNVNKDKAYLVEDE
tara:strand:+ start:251 stop:880 length:630 start_codon:yes stop_codon:yes gene_type:complete